MNPRALNTAATQVERCGEGNTARPASLQAFRTA
jgi:hypothetical protein